MICLWKTYDTAVYLIFLSTPKSTSNSTNKSQVKTINFKVKTNKACSQNPSQDPKFPGKDMQVGKSFVKTKLSQDPQAPCHEQVPSNDQVLNFVFWVPNKSLYTLHKV